MPDEPKIKLFKIESQRAQTFLFKVPRLADMDGANALLGDLFRQQLPKALNEYLIAPPDTRGDIESSLKNVIPASGDPIGKSFSSENKSELSSDDVPYEAFDRGILVRDGGRFWGLIAEDNIESAKEVAAATIHERCPGLGYAFHVGDPYNENASEDTPSETATDLVALPCFRWSEDGGDEPASELLRIGDDERFIARSSKKKREARKENAALWDIASILRSSKHIPVSDQDPNTVDFTEIANGRYLAVIHMDGNGIGQRSMNYARDIEGVDFITRQEKMETFFYGMRSAMRAAVTVALNEHFEENPNHYRLLMLGGDDVLIVCRADKALPLVTSVARSLAGHELADGKPLTIGTGIAIGKPKLPFHRLHELAEQLASSAKQIAIAPDGTPRSVADWLITTSSWVDSVDDHRARWERIRYATEDGTETLLLTSKPYPMLQTPQTEQPEASHEPSIEALLKFCHELREKFYAKDSDGEGIRSQLKHFLGELRKGRTYAELAWAELPVNARGHFQQHAPIGFDAPEADGNGLWLELGNSAYKCWVADVIELIELQQIGRQTRADANAALKAPINDGEAA